MFDTNKEFEKIAKELVDLHTKKNSNYGNSYSKLYDELGEIAALVPLHNKLDRLTNLVKGGQNYFESKEDTLRDLASYAIMMLVEMHRKANKKREDDMWYKDIDDAMAKKYGVRTEPYKKDDNEKCNDTVTIHLKNNSPLRYSDTPLKCYDNDRGIIPDDDKRNTISIKSEESITDKVFKSIFTNPFTKEKTTDEKQKD